MQCSLLLVYSRKVIDTLILCFYIEGDCVYLDLGMESGSIPDSKITASSEQSANTPAKNGRLNFTSGSSWCAGTSDTNPYLQIDLQTLHIICAVSTQGNSQADQWVKNYTLNISTDGSGWTDYKEIGRVKVTNTLLLYFYAQNKQTFHEFLSSADWFILMYCTLFPAIGYGSAITCISFTS